MGKGNVFGIGAAVVKENIFWNGNNDSEEKKSFRNGIGMVK